MVYADNKWCGTTACRDDDGDHGDTTIWTSELIKCPDGYSANGTKIFPWGIDGYHLRKCIRQIPGNKLDCALGKYSASKCPNYFAKNQPESINYMNNYCSGNRIVINDDCKEWKDVNLQAYTNKLARFCNSHIDNVYKYQECKTYCKDNPGKCENVMHRYCSLHKDDPLCGCINSPLNDLPVGSKGQPPATCFDNTCISFGYKPDANARGVRRSNVNECGDFMDCSQNINVSDKAFLDRVKISQNCILKKKEEYKKKAYKEATEATEAAKKNRESELAAILAKEAAIKAEKARRELEREKLKYLAETPVWKQKYDSIVSSGPLKNITDNINNTIPDTNLIVGGIEIDSIKPLLVLLFIIIVLISTIQFPTDNYNNQYQYYPQY